ncbi:MAG: hypothetical protein OEV44_07265, partial [Spirochaetota bacterium]|nr:hypothetical protein [Spirochaetota bacterium]
MNRVQKTVEVAKHLMPESAEQDPTIYTQGESVGGTGIYGGEEVQTVFETTGSGMQTSTSSIPHINFKNVDIEGVTLKNVNLSDLNQTGGRMVSEELLSDAIDYTINKISSNFGKIASVDPSIFDKPDFRGDKLFSNQEADDFVGSVNESDVKLTDQFFNKIDDLKNEIESLNDNIEDLKPAFISKISDSLFPKHQPKEDITPDEVRKPLRKKSKDQEMDYEDIEKAIFQDQESEILNETRKTDETTINEDEIQLSDAFFDNIDNLRTDMNKVKEEVEDLKSASIGDITDSIFSKPTPEKGFDHTSFQENLKLTNEFFDKVNSLASKIRQGDIEEDINIANSLFDESEKPAQSDVKLDQDFFKNIESIHGEVNDQINNIIDKKFDQSASHKNLDELISRNESLEKELDVFKNLVGMLNEEKEKREETEKSLGEFEKSLEKLKDQLSNQEQKEQEDDEYEPEKPLEVFKANEEVVKKKIKKNIPKEDLDKMQYFPDSESHDDEDEKDFQSLDEVLDEDLSHVNTMTRDDALREEAKHEYPEDVDPSMFPNPYNPSVDYQNDNGFFQDIAGAPIIVKQTTIAANAEVIADEITPPLDEQKEMPKEEEKTGHPKKKSAPPIKTSSVETQTIQIEAQLHEAPPTPKPRKSLKKPIQLTYDFRNLFSNKYYRKYRDMLNEAAFLVADKKLDEALEYYYVIQDQNIPKSFKMMIQANIRDIEETISDTFRYSDTIVKVDESGEVSRVKVVEEEEYEGEEYEYDDEHRAVLTREVAFRE